MSSDWSYISVLHWPRGWGEPQRIVALVEAIGVDPVDATALARGETPLVAARLPSAAARAAAQPLVARGVGVLITSHQSLVDSPAPVRAKRLMLTADGASVEPWRGQTVSLTADDVWLIIRGKLTCKRTSGAGPKPMPWRADPRDGSMMDEPDVGDWSGLSGRAGTPSVVIRDVIELHDRRGVRVRIDGSKFNFDVLGPERALSDHANADRLAVRLAERMPRAIVDLGFAKFAAPMWIRGIMPTARGVDRQRFPDDDPAFEFYSVWVAEVYRHLVSAGDGRGETGAA